jgi:hypothetical protein
VGPRAGLDTEARGKILTNYRLNLLGKLLGHYTFTEVETSYRRDKMHIVVLLSIHV